MEYDDGLIATTPEALIIRRYSLLLGTKTIPYGEISGVERRALGTGSGRGRIWGTTLPGTWYNLDLKRPQKAVAFLIRTRSTVTPVITPDDPDALAASLRGHGVATPAA